MVIMEEVEDLCNMYTWCIPGDDNDDIDDLGADYSYQSREWSAGKKIWCAMFQPACLMTTLVEVQDLSNKHVHVESEN